MKIALCLSGELRAFKSCLHTIKIAFPSSSVDIFAALWSREDPKDVDYLNDNFNVKKLTIVGDDSSLFDDLYKHEELWIHRGLSKITKAENWKFLPIWQLGRIERLAKIAGTVNDDSYEYIVRSRPDTVYLTNLEKLMGNHILVSEDIGGSAPWDVWNTSRMVYDGFAAGPQNLMKQYYNFSEWLKSYNNLTREVLKAERTLGWYLTIINAPLSFQRDILGLQINETQWYNRSNPPVDNNLSKKQQDTFKFYLENLKKYHNGTYQIFKDRFS